MILTLFASAALAVPAVQDPRPADVTGELVDLAKQLAAAESYTFTSTSEGSGGGFGGRGGFGGGPGGGEGGGAQGRAPRITTVNGAYRAGLPLRLELGDRLAFMEGETLVHKDSEGKWQVLEPGRGGFGGGPGGGPGGEPDAGGADRADRDSMLALFQLRAVDAPHALFADFGDKLKTVSAEVVRVESDDPAAALEKRVFSGELSESGARALGGGLGFGGRGGFGGGPPGGGPPEGGEGGGDAPADRPQATVTGTFRIEVTGGAITSVTFETKRTFTIRDETVERTSKRTLGFSKVGETSYEVPEEVLALFEI